MVTDELCSDIDIVIADVIVVVVYQPHVVVEARYMYKDSTPLLKKYVKTIIIILSM